MSTNPEIEISGAIELYRLILTDTNTTWQNAEDSDVLPKREIDLLAEHTVTELVGDDSLGHLQDLEDFINTIETSDTNMDTFFETRFSTHKIKRHNRWLELSEDVFLIIFFLVRVDFLLGNALLLHTLDQVHV